MAGTAQARDGTAGSVPTTDLCDANEDALASGDLQVAMPGFLSFGQRGAFAGPALTLRCFEDNALVRRALETDGHGRVLVVDGGASLRCALVGGNLARLAAGNGWRGIIVNGCVRDADEIDGCDIGVRALHLNPRRSDKQGRGEFDVELEFAGVRICPGDAIHADRDGWLVARVPLAAS